MKYLPTESNILGEIIVGYRQKEKVKMSEQPKVTQSNDAAKYLRNLYHTEQANHIESVIILPLNSQNRIMGWAKVSQGGITSTLMDVRVIMQILLNANATNFVISHNHPSGGTQPSDADKKITQQVKEAGKILEIRLIDHVIIGEYDQYYSFADEGNL